MTTFYEMVCAEWDALNERDQLDAITLRKLATFLDDDKSRRDGQTVVVNNGVGIVAYKGTPVAEFTVFKNLCRVRSPNSNWLGPLEHGDAIIDLARIVADGIRRAQKHEARAA
jgi:hypothetical protein